WKRYEQWGQGRCDHRVAGDQGDVVFGPVAGGVDSAGHGPGVGPGPIRAGVKYRPGFNERRWDLLTDRYWFVSDDVPGTGQSPLQRNAANHRRPETDHLIAGLELGAGSAVHVHPGLGLLTGSPGVPYRADHRRACPVYRYGVYLVWHGLRGWRGRSRARRHQLSVPISCLCSTGLVLLTSSPLLVGS